MLKLRRRKVLVFGEYAIVQVILARFVEEGFEAWQKTRFRLPSVSDPNSLIEIRKILAEFSADCIASSSEGFVHPGTTYWAERSELPDVAQEFGLTVFCPPMRVLSLFNNRLNFLAEADTLGIPHLVLSFDPMNTVREIEKFAQNVSPGFPFVLRAARGGGSLSSLTVQNSQSLQKVLPLWCDQLRWGHGEVILFAERALESARRIAVPFARFQDGRVQIFPMIDCSLQMNYQKVIEFCPAIHVDPEVRQNLVRWTSQFIGRCGFIGVGAMEFLVEGERAYLVEGLSRLNTGFHLWEKVAGTNAIAWQIATSGRRLEKSTPAVRSESEWQNGIGLHVQAEDSFLHLPQPGYIRKIIPESDHWKPNYQSDEWVSPSDTGVVAYLFVTTKSRKQCIPLARRALCDFWIEGSVPVNTRFLLDLLDHPWVKEEIFHIQFIDEEFVPNFHLPQELKNLAISVCRALEKRDLPSLAWHCPEETFVFDGGQGVSGSLDFPAGGQIRICAFPVRHHWLVRIGSDSLQVNSSLRKKSGSAEGVRALKALVGGRVHAIFYLPKVWIQAHEVLVIIESFGIFVPHSLPITSRVVRWKVTAEDRVVAGQELAELERIRVAPEP